LVQPAAAIFGYRITISCIIKKLGEDTEDISKKRVQAESDKIGIRAAQRILRFTLLTHNVTLFVILSVKRYKNFK